MPIESSMGKITDGGIPEKEIHPERKLSDEQEEKLQKTKEIFDKQYQFIINGLNNNKTLPDFYKDFSDKLDKILEGVVEKSDDPEIVNTLIKAVNINREILVDYSRNKRNKDFFYVVDKNGLETREIKAENPDECIKTILSGKNNYQEIKRELTDADAEITKLTSKITTGPLNIQYRIARNLLKEAEEGNDSEKLIYTAMAKNALENYKIMIQSPDMRRVLNISDYDGSAFLEQEDLEKEIAKFAGEENQSKRIEELLNKKRKLLEELEKLDQQIKK